MLNMCEVVRPSWWRSWIHIKLLTVADKSMSWMFKSWGKSEVNLPAELKVIIENKESGNHLSLSFSFSRTKCVKTSLCSRLRWIVDYPASSGPVVASCVNLGSELLHIQEPVSSRRIHPDVPWAFQYPFRGCDNFCPWQWDRWAEQERSEQFLLQRQMR